MAHDDFFNTCNCGRRIAPTVHDCGPDCEAKLVEEMSKEAQEEIDKMRTEQEIKDSVKEVKITEQEIKDLVKEVKIAEAAEKEYIDIKNPITREIHLLLNDDNYDLHEVNRDSTHLEEGWTGYLSAPLPKNTFRAALYGLGICQVIDGKLVSRFKNEEFVFVKRIGGRSVF